MALTTRDVLGKAASTRPRAAGMEETVGAFQAVVNITKMLVVGRGRGFIRTFRPGDISTYHDGGCVQFIDYGVAEQMFKRRKAFLKLLPLAEGRALLKRARDLRDRGDSDPFRSALAKEYPEWAVQTEVEALMAQNELDMLRAQYKDMTRQDPLPQWDRTKLRQLISAGSAVAVTRGNASRVSVMEQLGFDEPVSTGRPVSLDAPVDEDEDEVPDVSEVKRQVELGQNPEVEEQKAALRAELARMNIKTSGRASLGHLKNKLAEALAARTAATRA